MLVLVSFGLDLGLMLDGLGLRGVLAILISELLPLAQNFPNGLQTSHWLKLNVQVYVRAGDKPLQPIWEVLSPVCIWNKNEMLSARDPGPFVRMFFRMFHFSTNHVLQNVLQGVYLS